MKNAIVTIWVMVVFTTLLVFCTSTQATLQDGLVAYYPYLWQRK
jgi:hypothetical protein